MIDLAHLERRKLTKLYDNEGYTCECGNWVTVFVTSQSLDKAMEKLARMKTTRPDYRFHFLKTLKKATALQQKVKSYD